MFQPQEGFRIAVFTVNCNKKINLKYMVNINKISGLLLKLNDKENKFSPSIHTGQLLNFFFFLLLGG